MLEVKEEEILSLLRINKSIREKSIEVLVYKYNISILIALYILYKYSLNNVKLTIKLSLNLK